MARKDVGSFRPGDNEIHWFFTIDRPLHNTQVMKLSDEIDEFIQICSSTPKWYEYYSGTTHDGYGSFRLDFDPSIWDLSDQELEEISEDIFEMVIQTDIIDTLNIWTSIEEDLEGYLESQPREEVMEMYIDAVLDSGYRIKQCDVEDIFNWDNEDPRMAQIIANDFLLRKLKGQNVVCKELQTTSEQAVV